MEMTINRSDLATMLTRAAGVVSKKSPLEALKAVLLDASADSLTASATDTYLGIEATVDASVKTPGRLAADAVRMAEIVRNLPAGEVTLRETKGHLEIKCGKARFKVATMNADDFPRLPQAADSSLVVSVDARELVRALAQGAYAMRADDSMPQLNAALIDSTGDEVRLVSSDSKRLTVSSLTAAGAVGRMLVPAKGVSELKKLADANKGSTIELRRSGLTAFFVAGGVALSVKLLDMAYLPYWKLFPEESKYSVTFQRDMLADMVRRVALVSAGQEGGTVQLAFSEGTLKVYGSSADAGEGEDFLECNSNFSLELRVQPQFFVEAVTAVSDDEVRIDLTGELGPVVVNGATSTECRGIMMPRHAVQ